MTTVACLQCGAQFAIAHRSSCPDQALAARQAIWLADRFVWDHIQGKQPQKLDPVAGIKQNEAIGEYLVQSAMVTSQDLTVCVSRESSNANAIGSCGRHSDFSNRGRRRKSVFSRFFRTFLRRSRRLVGPSRPGLCSRTMRPWLGSWFVSTGTRPHVIVDPPRNCRLYRG
jgi:hypothetical protein